MTNCQFNIVFATNSELKDNPRSCKRALGTFTHGAMRRDAIRAISSQLAI